MQHKQEPHDHEERSKISPTSSNGVNLIDAPVAFGDPTPGCSAPEVLAYLPVDEKADMWAVGMVMWVLLTGQHPFDPNGDLSEGQVAGRILFVDLDLKVSKLRHSNVRWAARFGRCAGALLGVRLGDRRMAHIYSLIYTVVLGDKVEPGNHG